MLLDAFLKFYKGFCKWNAFTKRYTFENRSKNKENLCYILAGYKNFTWDNIFNRINKFSNDDMDICIVSSGLYSEELSSIAKKYGWSYLSIKRNCVTLAQNMVIKLFPNAEYIYKLDEDIFITQNFFNTLKESYIKIQNEGDYNIGFITPLIPINGYAHYILLKKLNLIEYYEKNFEKLKFAAGSDRMIENNLEVAKFMWGKGGYIPHIDDLNKIFLNNDFSYSASPVKFSIGSILFKRDLWEDMGYFKVQPGTCMGFDEILLCSFCINNSKAIVVSENCCVGHLSFGLQNKGMMDYYKNHPESFNIKLK